MAMLANTGAGSRSTSPRTIVALVVGVAVLLALMVTAFALPAARSAPHHVPVGVVAADGSAQASAQVQKLSGSLEGFEVTRYGSVADARSAIEHREVYGAVVVSRDAVTSLVATAASPTVAAMIPTIGDRLAAATGESARVVDVRSFPDRDPKGAGLAAGALPLALGGWIAAMVIMLLVHSPGLRLAAAAGVAVVGGVVLIATLRFVIGTIDDGFWLPTLVAALGIAATAMMVLGLRELLGGAGLGVAAILLIFLGNPLSGLASAPEMLPTPWGLIGQLLPPGATGSLLRDVAFFDGHGALRPLTVLVCWLVAGLALYGAGVWRNRRRHEVDEDEVRIGHRPGVDEVTSPA
ncbi:hypothetical protein [Gordonia soli]|uniref:ABC transporter permease n=1 Tax=Gordonia soli NBRC 108243 TaxID=1223545 RepID=M0QIA4_9ACTN|nr:hypothetical protein [Gordonia soli]GAC68026.1 hypothetical protein GS4_11_02980 [Gordonia soli NBRC 108243]